MSTLSILNCGIVPRFFEAECEPPISMVAILCFGAVSELAVAAEDSVSDGASVLDSAVAALGSALNGTTLYSVVGYLLW